MASDPARVVGRRCRYVGGERGREPDHLEAVFIRDRGGVRYAAELERGDAAGVVELGKARAVGRRVHPLERAVRVDADQLDAVVDMRGHNGVYGAAELERVYV